MGRLEPFGDSIWVVPQPFKLMGFAFGTKATLIRRPGRKLLLYSTVNIDDALFKEIEALGTLEVIIAPAAFHTTYLLQFQSRFPRARFLAAPSIQKKVPELDVAGNVSDDTLGEWKDHVRAFRTKGSKANEWVLYHPLSKTLMITDLAFNFKNPEGFLNKLFLKMLGAENRFTPSRLFKSTIKDHAAMRASLEEIFKEDIQQISMAHGDLIKSNGGVELRAAYQWLYEDNVDQKS